MERRKSGHSEQSLCCPACQQIFDNFDKKKSHMKNVHPHLKSLDCKQCPKAIFHSHLHLKAHQKFKILSLPNKRPRTANDFGQNFHTGRSYLVQDAY